MPTGRTKIIQPLEAGIVTAMVLEKMKVRPVEEADRKTERL